jgi:cell division protease FtsH
MGAQPPKGVLLFGPPGCGKTLLARAVAGEAHVPFFAISGAEFVESLVGVGAARVRDLFRQASNAAPAIVFIDELDAAGRRRGAGGGSGGSDEREQTLNQMLVAMDGFEVSSGIVVMGATNRPDILDPALLRPGRFDRHVMVDEPDLAGRAEILAVHARNRPLASDVDLGLVAQRTPGFTGADLANVVNEAILLALREGHTEVRMAQVTEAIQRVLHGPRRRGRLLTDEERERIAYHESGHAVVAASLGRLGEVARVSVVARGRGLGASLIAAGGDRVLSTRSELFAQLVIAIGGMVSEQLVFGEPSTGAEDDVERVTHLARRIAGRYGMSAQIGIVRVLAPDSDGFLGGEDAVGEVSGEMLRDLEHEVRRLSDDAAAHAREALTRHRATLDRLAAALLQMETLEGRDLEAIVGQIELNGEVRRPGAILPSLTDVEL